MTSKREKLSSIEASEWWVRLRDEACSDHERAAFVDWLRAAPENVAEYLALANVWQGVGEVVPNLDLNAILAELADDNVLPYPKPRDQGLAFSRPHRRRRLSWLAAACVAVVAVVATYAFLIDPTVTIETAIGEQRSIVLSDGSILTLNTKSKIQYEFDESFRRVALIDGEALFEVSRDVKRPFIVTVGPTIIRVLGTRFNIFKKSTTDTNITVLEGLVTVSTPAATTPLNKSTNGVSPGDAGEVLLKVGEQIRIRAQHSTKEKQVQVGKVVEWTSRRLSFENTELRDVVAEFNRYNVLQIQIDDPALSSLRLNGVFEPHSHEILLEYLMKTENIQVHDFGNRRVISR